MISSQTSLFEPFSKFISVETKTEAIERVKSNMNPEWAKRAMDCLREVATRKEYFTSDDVREALLGHPEKTRTLSALGSIFKDANGVYCLPADRMPIASIIPSSHGRMLRVWKSLLYTL